MISAKQWQMPVFTFQGLHRLRLLGQQWTLSVVITLWFLWCLACQSHNTTQDLIP